MTTTRRAYRGGAKAGRLTAPTGTTDTLIACDALPSWPDGSDGMFAAVIGKGLANEEKMLVETRTGANLTIHQRGYDGTVPANHSATETVEHCHTATDDDEANEHSSSVSGHGVPVSDRIVGESKAATLKNKILDGAQNTFSNIPSAASPETSDRLDAAEDDITALETGLANEVTNRTNAVNGEATTRADADAAEATARANGDAARYTKAEADAKFLDQTEGDARYLRPPVDSDWQTSTTGFVIKTGFSLTSVRYRTVTQGALVYIDLFIQVQKNSSPLSVGSKGDVANTPVVTIPAALRPTASIGLHGPVSAGRICSALVDTAGLVTLTAAGGTADIASEALSMRGFFLQ